MIIIGAGLKTAVMFGDQCNRKKLNIASVAAQRWRKDRIIEDCRLEMSKWILFMRTE